MDNTKWLKRKYPETFDELHEFLGDFTINEFRVRKFKVGRFVKDFKSLGGQEYKTGTLIIFKRANPVNSPNYPLHFAIVKCDKTITESGFHSINLWESDFIEINK
jgi:hypothetical protein